MRGWGDAQLHVDITLPASCTLRHFGGAGVLAPFFTLLLLYPFFHHGLEPLCVYGILPQYWGWSTIYIVILFILFQMALEKTLYLLLPLETLIKFG